MPVITPDLSALPVRLPREAKDPKKMLTISTDPDGRTRVEINNSSLGIILACGRKAWYSLERKLAGLSDSPPLVFGTAIHAGLEVFYSEPPENRTIPANFREIADDIAYGTRSVADYEGEHFLFRALARFLEKAEPLNVLAQSDKRSPCTGVWLLTNYFETHINDQYVVYSDEQGPMTERMASHVIYEDESLVIELFGTIDVVLRDTVTGQIMPGDHKTASQLGNDFYNRLKPNHQYTGYIVLAREALNLDVNYFLVNALQVKERPKTARGSGPNFARQITTRDANDIAEFTRTVTWAVRSYLAWRESGFWPMGQVNECAAYGACQYLDVCSAPTELREQIIKSRYMENT